MPVLILRTIIKRVRAQERDAMRVISKRRLRAFWQRHVAARSPLEGWFRVVNDKRLSWSDFHDVKRTYGNASLVGDCVVFNIGGNKYRLIAWVNYQYGVVYVRFIGTHRDYDGIDAQNV